ncbi:iron uptake transporter permease EfeU [Curtobacterium sp. MCBD17_030]|uniref:iron uptake transporter permease EfeU n=1 Tax=Curtobacterium sp. MCBD17_030 TaxID=2175649 RepID=UPI000D83D093|nr:iron uptake transporter permease EfeU [Curtobacterium sp. MCBD17_030]PYY32327.1 ferrous iron transporter [Curtobacterium sp. MCBD17_030]
MLATLVIGLREGLEATLIVGIIAAFLRRNRVPLGPMWTGVGVAVLLSIAVGLGLQAVEQALPQAQQEAMEALIGIVAVVFVTGMIVWMRSHARHLGRELEASASAALGRGTAWALAGMAFLAVLKEGFETSVFLLATFQASSDTGPAAVGAVVGIATAVVIGYGIYTGGVRLDLAKFFTGTGVFLVFVAAGLVLTVLRRAHEAGWVVIGQQRTVDLAWLAPNGSVRGALVTGVLGIPPDPRVVEVLGWVLYVVPVLALSLWPRRWKPSVVRVPTVRIAVASGLVVAAFALAVAVPTGHPDVPATAKVTGDASSVTARVSGSSASLRVGGSSTGSTGREARITLPASAHRRVVRAGTATARWRLTSDRAPSDAADTDQPATLTLDDLVQLFGRIPVGISPSSAPGPYRASWATRDTVTLWSADGGVVDASRVERSVLTLTGGGLPTARTSTLDRTVWAVPRATVDRTTAALAADRTHTAELALWTRWLPLALGIAAAAQVLLALRDRSRLGLPDSTVPSTTPTRGPPVTATARSTDAVR